MKKFVVLLVAVITLLAVVPTVLAGTQTQQFCDFATDTTKVQAWENSIGDTSDGNDTFRVCFDIWDLDDIGHSPAGDCHGGLLGNGTWNDCISSAHIWLPPAPWHACFYSEAGYTGLLHGFTGPINGVRFNLNGANLISSISIRRYAC